VKLEALQNMQGDILKFLDREIDLEDTEQRCPDPAELVSSLEERTEVLRRMLMHRKRGEQVGSLKVQGAS
jgi:hypothetical protein